MVAATGNLAFPLPESLLCSFVVVSEPLLEEESPELAPAAAVAVTIAVETGIGPSPEDDT